MNNHHEMKINMELEMGHQQHDVKMSGHPHEIKMNIGEMHDIKMNLHDMKMNHQHDIEMNHQHDIKMNHPQDIKMNMQHEGIHRDHISQPHNIMDINLQQMPQAQEMPAMEVNNVSNIPTEPRPKAEQSTKTTAEGKKTKLEKKKKEAIDGQAREVIFKVIKFFESEKQNRGYAFPVENVVKRACAATGLSESTIKRIKRDGLRAEATQTRMTGPKKKRVRKTKVQLDYFQLCALRGIVNNYSMRKEVPTLGKILAAAKHELNYRGGKESLRLILLNKLGIKFKKCEKKNKKPPEESPAQVPQMQNTMPVQPMQHMKVMENQCVPHYANMIPPVSY